MTMLNSLRLRSSRAGHQPRRLMPVPLLLGPKLRLADCSKPGSFDGGAHSSLLSAVVLHKENRTADPKFRAPGGVVLSTMLRHFAASRRNQQRPRSTSEMNAPGRCDVQAITHVIASTSYASPERQLSKNALRRSMHSGQVSAACRPSEMP
jgi:hypothetical protein